MDHQKHPDQTLNWPAVERRKKARPAGVVIASGMSMENINYRVGDRSVLDNVSLEVLPGEVLCLLGPSGSGKTSLLKIAAGLIEDAGGRVLIDGRPIVDDGLFVPPDKRGIGLVFQDFALFPHLTIRKNVEFGLSAMDRKEAHQQAERVLERVGLLDRADQYPHVLSGGEQQRVALARAFAPRPGILLMDEPFSGLDSRLRDSIREESVSLLRETRSTAIIVTHDAEEALRVGDKIALLKDGKLVQYGTGHDLYYSPASLFAASFFSEVNILPIAVREGRVWSVFGDHGLANETGMEESGAVRHTDVALFPYIAGEPGVPGRIISRRFLGTTELLGVKVEGLDRPFHARLRPGQIAENVEQVLIRLESGSMMIFPASTN